MVVQIRERVNGYIVLFRSLALWLSPRSIFKYTKANYVLRGVDIESLKQLYTKFGFYVLGLHFRIALARMLLFAPAMKEDLNVELGEKYRRSGPLKKG